MSKTSPAKPKAAQGKGKPAKLTKVLATRPAKAAKATAKKKATAAK